MELLIRKILYLVAPEDSSRGHKNSYLLRPDLLSGLFKWLFWYLAALALGLFLAGLH